MLGKKMKNAVLVNLVVELNPLIGDNPSVISNKSLLIADCVFSSNEKAQEYILFMNDEIKKFKEVLESFYYAKLEWIKDNSYSQIKRIVIMNEDSFSTEEKNTLQKQIKEKNAEIDKDNIKLSTNYANNMKMFTESYFKNNLTKDLYKFFIMWNDEGLIPVEYKSRTIDFKD